MADRRGDNGEFFDNEITTIMLDSKEPYVKPKGGYFDETIQSEKTVLEMATGPVEVVEKVKAEPEQVDLIKELDLDPAPTESVEAQTAEEVKAEIDYQAELEKEKKNYEELRRLQGRQSTELGNLREDYEKAMEALEENFDMVDGKAVLKKDKQLDASKIERKQAGGGKMKMGGKVSKKK